MLINSDEDLLKRPNHCCKAMATDVPVSLQMAETLVRASVRVMISCSMITTSKKE